MREYLYVGSRSLFILMVDIADLTISMDPFRIVHEGKRDHKCPSCDKTFSVRAPRSSQIVRTHNLNTLAGADKRKEPYSRCA